MLLLFHFCLGFFGALGGSVIILVSLGVSAVQFVFDLLGD